MLEGRTDELCDFNDSDLPIHENVDAVKHMACALGISTYLRYVLISCQYLKFLQFKRLI